MSGKKKSKGPASKKQQNRKKSARKQPQLGSGLQSKQLEMPKVTFRGAKGTGLSNCAELYLKALVNPWGEFTELPCVPCTPSDMTFRARFLTRGSFQCGSAGVGYVRWAPLNPTNDVNSIQYTTGAFAGTNFSAIGTAGVTTTAKVSNLFGNAVFSTAQGSVCARLVGSGIRVTNTSAPLYRQGSVQAVRYGTGTDLSVITPTFQAGNLENVKKAADQKDWFYWSFIPQTEDDYDFAPQATSYVATTGRGAMNYGVMVQGAAASNTFDFELIEFWEFSGGSASNNMPSLSKSHADPVGLSRVMEAVSVPRQSLDLKDQARVYAENAIDSMAHSDSAAKTVEDLLGTAGLSLGAINTLVGSLTKMILA